MARERASRERMRATAERWQRSGMSAASFCRREGIQARRLWYGKRVLGVGASRRRVVDQPRLTPVRVVDLGLAGAAGIEVLVGGERLVVREGVTLDLLRAVVDVLRERC